MPSRRDALAAVGSAATLSLTGCLGVTHAPSAYCQLKAISVEWAHDDQRYRDEVGRSMGHPPVNGNGGEVRTSVAEELPGLASGPRDLVVSDELADRLERSFSAIEYLLGFCGDAFDTCRNTRATSRAAFNEVQVGDEARVTLVDDAFRVHSADAPSNEALAEWVTEFRTVDFSERHADAGEPLGDDS